MTENDLTFRTTDLAQWGAGKGSNLEPGEVDQNFWNLLVRIAFLEDNPPQPDNIQSFQLVGTQFVVIMESGQQFGPFDLPFGAFRWEGEYEAGKDYLGFDVVTVEGVGLFLALHDFTSATEFDPDEEDTEGPLWHLLFGNATIYDLGMFISGKPGEGLTSDNVLFQYLAVRPIYLPAGGGLSMAWLEVAPTAPVTYNLIKGTGTEGYTEVGTITFEIGSNEGVVTVPSDVLLAAGDRLYISTPIFVDATEEPTDPINIDDTAEDLSVTLACIRGVPA